MRPFRSILILLAACCAALVLASCSGEPDVNRVDVTWTSLEPSPRWGLYPGYRQEIEFRKRSAYQIDVYVEDKQITGGALGDTGSSLAFRSTAGARDIEAQAAGPYALDIYVTLKNKKGESRRVHCLKVERTGDKISFEFLKQ